MYTYQFFRYVLDLLRLGMTIKDVAHRTGILSWYDAEVTDAILEGTNNKIRVRKRKAYSNDG